jgi:hypothetical protein
MRPETDSGLDKEVQVCCLILAALLCDMSLIFLGDEMLEACVLFGGSGL